MNKAIAKAVQALRRSGYWVQVRIHAGSRQYGALVKSPKAKKPTWWPSSKLLRQAVQVQPQEGETHEP